jgi:hypothetical protein
LLAVSSKPKLCLPDTNIVIVTRLSTIRSAIATMRRSSGPMVVPPRRMTARDRLHPEKRDRPIAAGRVSKRTAAVLFVLLWGAGVAAGYLLGPRFGAACASYVVLNLLYTLWLKHQVIIDVMGISVGFMIRAIGGVEVLRDVDPTIALSPWLLLCTFFLALVMGFGKRRSELGLLDEDASHHRAALGDYSGPSCR